MRLGLRIDLTLGRFLTVSHELYRWSALSCLITRDRVDAAQSQHFLVSSRESPFPDRVWEREGKQGSEISKKVPVRTMTNGHVNCNSARSYCPTMVAPRKLSTSLIGLAIASV